MKLAMGGCVPRRYTLGKRGEAKDETRRRIVEATLQLYREVGIGGATVPRIARAADVAPATVRNHFPEPNALAQAAADAILDGLGMPDESIFAGAPSTLERVERLLVEVAAFFERSAGWWEVRVADQTQGNSWGAPEAQYNERLAALIRAAVAPLDDDPIVAGVIGSVLVQVYFTVRGAGGSSEAAIDVERQLLVPWLEARLAARDARP
jgi:AcrR family transcriptional regulator